MAGSTAYANWKKRGEPYKDCKPIADFAITIRAYGYTVWTKGNEKHLQAIPPEDHTPFSATGWPQISAFGIGHAADVANKNTPYPLWRIAEQIIRDKDAKLPGTEWIKYINYTDENGDCWHVSWQPNKAKRKSADKGHIHLSARSDMDTKATTYDPIKRLLENDMPSAEDVLKADIVPNPEWRPDAKTNPTVKVGFAINDAWNRAHAAQEENKALKARLEVLENLIAGTNSGSASGA